MVSPRKDSAAAAGTLREKSFPKIAFFPLPNPATLIFSIVSLSHWGCGTRFRDFCVSVLFVVVSMSHARCGTKDDAVGQSQPKRKGPATMPGPIGITYLLRD